MVAAIAGCGIGSVCCGFMCGGSGVDASRFVVVVTIIAVAVVVSMVAVAVVVSALAMSAMQCLAVNVLSVPIFLCIIVVASSGCVGGCFRIVASDGDSISMVVAHRRPVMVDYFVLGGRR